MSAQTQRRLYVLAQDPHEFERFVTEIILSEHPDAEAVDGSGGDGGVEVLTEDGRVGWQVKKFFERLKTPQKNQMEESLRTAIREWEVENYRFVLPLERSRSEHKWFRGVRAEVSPVHVTWLGLNWISKMCGIHDDVWRRYDPVQHEQQQALGLDDIRDVVEQAVRTALEASKHSPVEAAASLTGEHTPRLETPPTDRVDDAAPAAAESLLPTTVAAPPADILTAAQRAGWPTRDRQPPKRQQFGLRQRNGRLLFLRGHGEVGLCSIVFASDPSVSPRVTVDMTSFVRRADSDGLVLELANDSRVVTVTVRRKEKRISGSIAVSVPPSGAKPEHVLEGAAALDACIAGQRWSIGGFHFTGEGRADRSENGDELVRYATNLRDINALAGKNLLIPARYREGQARQAEHVANLLRGTVQTFTATRPQELGFESEAAAISFIEQIPTGDQQSLRVRSVLNVGEAEVPVFEQHDLDGVQVRRERERVYFDPKGESMSVTVRTYPPRRDEL